MLVTRFTSERSVICLAMAPHFTTKELDQFKKWRALTPKAAHEKLKAQRDRKGIDTPNIKQIRKVLSGQTFRQGVVETRGRKKKLSKANVRRVNTVRKTLIKKANGEKEVAWEQILKVAKVPKVTPTTAKANLQDAGFDVARRNPRFKPMRTADHEEERVEICTKWARRPAEYWTDSVDMVIDNKSWGLPLNKTGKRYSKMRRVRWHLRTPSEGTKKGFTKPHPKTQRVNTGGKVSVLAGIVNCRIKVWHYLPAKRWNADEAVKAYEGPIAAALKKSHGPKRSYVLMEDNDPSGYKSKKAIEAKKKLKIKPMTYPRHSPDLNPLDFYVWAEIGRRMNKKDVKNETAADYKARLRRTALALPESALRKALRHIKQRSALVVKEDGGDITLD